MKTYAIPYKSLAVSEKRRKTLVLRDGPDALPPTVQEGYLDTVMAMFLKTLSKAYSPCDFTDADKTKLRGYLERIFEAKQAVEESGKPSNGCVTPE